MLNSFELNIIDRVWQIKNCLLCKKIKSRWFQGIFGIADFKYINNKKFKMADPIWRLKILKLACFA